MRRHYNPRQKTKDTPTNLTATVGMNFNLLTKLVHHIVDVEEKEQRFRTCVLVRLSRIEAMMTQALGCQLAQLWSDRTPMTADLRNKYMQDVQDKIESDSQALGLKMVHYIHQEHEKTQERHDRRRKWWGWEI
jgi:hypothetical protein